MRRQLTVASLVGTVIIAGSVWPALASDLPLSYQNTYKVVPVKKPSGSFSRVAVADWSQIRTTWHRYSFPLVLGITY
jgi:hypothetical protein